MKIESRIGTVPFSDEKVYYFISDFRNLNKFIPEDKISDWKSDKDRCSFKVDMIGPVGLFIVEKQPFKLVKIASDPAVKQQHDMTLWIQIKEVGENDSRIKITIEPKVNQILIGMIKGPLKKFVDNLVDEIEKFNFEK